MAVRLTAVLLIVLAAGCTGTVTGPEEFLATAFVDRIATVRAFSDGTSFFLDLGDGTSPPLVPYPEPLDRAFRQDGLAVQFSGELLPIPPNVRLPGPPIDVTAIRSLER